MREWRRTYRKQAAQSLAEGAAVMALMLPLFIVIIFVGGEVVQAYLIKNVLTQAASKAARDMSIDYWQDKSIANNRLLQNAQVFDRIRITGVVADSRQFSDAIFDTTAVPPTVTVTVTYSSGLYGLVPFPQPDPLGLGASFRLSSSTIHALE
jgi:Flp pilus assembly protein TadG